MADYSIIEFLVYGLIGYGGVIFSMLIVLIEPPTSQSLSGLRAVAIVPSIVCIGILMGFSGTITMGYDQAVVDPDYINSNSTDSITTSTTIIHAVEFDRNELVIGYVNTTSITTTISNNSASELAGASARTDTSVFILENPIWGIVHIMFFFMLIILFFVQIFNTITKFD